MKKSPPVKTSTWKNQKEGARIKQAATQAVYLTANWTILGTSHFIDPPLIGGCHVNGTEVGYLGWSVSIGRSVLTPDAYFTSSTPRSILTRSGELVVHLAGRPKDPSFVRSLQSVEGQVSAIRTCTSEKWAKRAKWGRGPHTSVSIGLSYGGGSKVCF